MKITIRLYQWAKKIHHLVVVCVGSGMALTGLMMKYPSWFARIDFGLIRWLHNQLSPLFGVLLGLMIATDICMYILPLMRKWKRNLFRN